MSVVPLTPWLAHRPRRGATVIDTVVLHAHEHESLEHLLHDLRSNDHSYHYIIDRGGTILKAVPFSAMAFHCGNSYGPHEAARGLSHERDATGAFVEHPSVNEYSIGVCLFNLNDGSAPYPQDQIQACATLLRDLKTPLPKLRFLTGHRHLSPGKAEDPADFDFLKMGKETGLGFWSLELLSV